MPVWLLRHYSMYVVGIQLHQNIRIYVFFFFLPSQSTRDREGLKRHA